MLLMTNSTHCLKQDQTYWENVVWKLCPLNKILTIVHYMTLDWWLADLSLHKTLQMTFAFYLLFLHEWLHSLNNLSKWITIKICTKSWLINEKDTLCLKINADFRYSIVCYKFNHPEPKKYMEKSKSFNLCLLISEGFPFHKFNNAFGLFISCIGYIFNNNCCWNRG